MFTRSLGNNLQITNVNQFKRKMKKRLVLFLYSRTEILAHLLFSNAKRKGGKKTCKKFSSWSMKKEQT